MGLRKRSYTSCHGMLPCGRLVLRSQQVRCRVTRQRARTIRVTDVLLGALAAALRSANEMAVTAGYPMPHGAPVIWDEDGHVYVYHAYGNPNKWHIFEDENPLRIAIADACS